MENKQYEKKVSKGTKVSAFYQGQFDELESFWENLINKNQNGQHTLCDSIKYVREYFRSNFSDNLTIIGICDELIDSNVDSTTSFSVEKSLEELRPLVIHFMDEADTSKPVQDILQYIELCEKEIEETDEAWISVTNILDLSCQRLRSILNTPKRKRSDGDEEDESIHSTLLQQHLQNGTVDVNVVYELSEQGKKIFRGNKSKGKEPGKEQIEAAAKLIESIASENPTRITQDMNKLTTLCKNGIEIDDNKIILSSVDSSFQRSELSSGFATLGRATSKRSRQDNFGNKDYSIDNANSTSSYLSEHGKLQTPQSPATMEESYQRVFKDTATATDVAGFTHAYSRKGSGILVTYTSIWEQNNLDAVARSIAQRNIYSAVKAALATISELKRTLSLKLTHNQLGQLNNVYSAWENIAADTYQDMDYDAPVTNFGYLINCIAPSQNCASNMLGACAQVLRDEDKANYFMEMHVDQLTMEFFKEGHTKDIGAYVNGAIQHGAECHAMSREGPPGLLVMADAGFSTDEQGYQIMMQPRNVVKRLLHQLYSRGSKFISNTTSKVIREHLTKPKYLEMMNMHDPTKHFETMMKEIYTELDANTAPGQTRRKAASPEDNSNSESNNVIEHQVNNALLNPAAPPFVPAKPKPSERPPQRRDTAEFKNEATQLHDAIVKNKSLTTKSFIQQFANTLNKQAEKEIVEVNNRKEVKYPFTLRVTNDGRKHYAIPPQIAKGTPTLVLQLLLIRDMLKEKTSFYADKDVISIMSQLREAARNEGLSMNTN